MRGRENKGPETDRWQRKDWWGIVLEAPDPHALLVFWSAILLDKPIHDESPTTAAHSTSARAWPTWRSRRPRSMSRRSGRPSRGSRACSCTSTSRSPISPLPWTHAVELGATVAEFQPQDDVRVLLDPAGHPFCLYT